MPYFVVAERPPLTPCTTGIPPQVPRCPCGGTNRACPAYAPAGSDAHDPTDGVR